MKLILLLISITLTLTNCQKNLNETQKLTSLVKVWGFLKYYHPNVADGKFNWDEQLFEMLPKVKNAADKEQLSVIYSNWIDSLGKIRTCEDCNKKSTHTSFDANFDLKWLDNELVFTEELSKKLRFIETNRHQGRKHYASTIQYAGNVKITNEETYQYDWENENLRLLTLARYWNIVEYFFPYKYQTDTNWNEVLNQIVLKFQHPKTELDFNLAMLELVVCVDDSHANLMTDLTNDFFGNQWIPAKFQIVEKKAIITDFYGASLAKRNDLQIGDIITKVNGKNIQTIYEEKEKYISGSNQAIKKINAFRAIFNGSTDSVTIEFVRSKKTIKKSIGRYAPDFLFYNPKQPDEKLRMLPDNIGYVNMGILEIEDIAHTMDSLSDTKAIIFDIRNYPNGTANAIAGYISSKPNDFYKKIIPDLDYPGKFIWENGDQYGNDEALKYHGKVILLVNASSQSHAEFTAMCLQTGDNVITIGNQTSGADGNVSQVDLVGGFETYITAIGIFYPDGQETQRKGVKVDLEIKPTLQGIVEGRDEVLEKAIEYANQL